VRGGDIVLENAAINFFVRLMHNLNLNVQRFSLSAFPEIKEMLWQSLGFSGAGSYFPAESSIREKTIYMIEDIFRWHYILLRLPQDKELMLVGPYLDEPASDQLIMTIMEEIGLSPSLFGEIRRQYQSLRIISGDNHLIPILNTLGDMLWGEECFSMEYLTLRRQTTDEPVSIELDRNSSLAPDVSLMEKRYEVETKLMYAIAHAQVHQAGAIMSMLNPDQIDKRNPNPLRNIKNYAIICNTLMRKAAQQGSVHPYYIDQLSSALGRRIEEAMTVNDVRKLMSSMVHKYCLLVKNHNMKGYSPPVQSVILRTDADLSGDLSLHVQAEKTGVNPSYLSALFKKETGVTLTEYVNRRRIEYAVFLLNSTNMQIQTIAQHCGMPDVNHFTRTFKRFTGKTPTQYRHSILAHP